MRLVIFLTTFVISFNGSTVPATAQASAPATEKNTPQTEKPGGIYGPCGGPIYGPSNEDKAMPYIIY